MLQAVTAAIESSLSILRSDRADGGDEFVCAFIDTGLEAAARRVEEIKTLVRQGRPVGSISVGLAELETGETLEELAARGDAELYWAKSGELARGG